MEPIEYVRALIRRWPIIAIGALLGAALAFIGTDANPQQVRSAYAATHTLLTTLQTFTANTQVGTVTFAQVPVFATTGEVPQRAAAELGWDGAPAALAAQVTVEADPSTGTIRFTTEQENPQDAVLIADAFADETVAYLAERQEQIRQTNLSSTLEDVERLEAEISDLDRQLAGQINTETGEVSTGSEVTRARRDAAVREYSVAYETYRALADESEATLNITTLERAQPVPVDSGGFTPPQSRATRVPLAALIGGLLGAAVALLVERLDSRLRDRRRAEEAFQASVVAELPTLSRKQRSQRLVVGPEHHHAVAEAFRSLRTSVTFMAVGGQPQSAGDHVGVILVTSPSPAEGKTTTAVNLAAAFAETGRSVIIINSDFRRPMAVSAVTDERPPLPAGLAGIDRLDATEFLSPTKVPGVDLLDLSPLGGTPGDLTRATLKMVGVLESRVDVVVIDTPPLAVTTEALEFVPVAKVVVLIGRLGHTATASAERAGELVRFGGAAQLAIALTDTGSGRLRKSSYYDYYREQDERPQSRSTRRTGGARKRQDSKTSPRSEPERRRATPGTVTEDEPLVPARAGPEAGDAFPDSSPDRGT